MMTISPGDVIILFDVTTTPPKTKWFCCVCVTPSWFMHINTNPRFHGQNQQITKLENPFLDHDSHIDFSGVRFQDRVLVQDALQTKNSYKGRLSRQTFQELIKNITSSRTIPRVQKNQILAELNQVE